MLAVTLSDCLYLDVFVHVQLNMKHAVLWPADNRMMFAKAFSCSGSISL